MKLIDIAWITRQNIKLVVTGFRSCNGFINSKYRSYKLSLCIY